MMYIYTCTEDVEELDDELVAEVDVELDEELEPACQRHVNTKRRNLSTFTSCQPFSANCKTLTNVAYRSTINRVSTFNGTCSNFPRYPNHSALVNPLDTR